MFYFDVFSLFRERGLPKHNKDSFIRNVKNSNAEDGVHLTTKGNRYIARKVFNFLKENFLIKKNMKIICFGDSLTYGAFLDGKGTSSGSTYSSFLFEKLN